MAPQPVGRVHGYEGAEVYVVLRSEETPNVGDLYYVREQGAYMVLQVKSPRARLPEGVKPIITHSETPSTLYHILTNPVAVAEPLFEIKQGGGGHYVVRPTHPPRLGAEVYKLTPQDEESKQIMRLLSRGITPATGEEGGSPVGVLRGGVAQAEEERARAYFTDAVLSLNLSDVVKKHILVAGQTGAGKTSGVMGMLARWARFSSSKMSWLIIDRHGEYSKTGASSFLDLVARALSANASPYMRGYRIYVYRFTPSEEAAERLGPAEIRVGGINLGSISYEDVASALEFSPERTTELESVVNLLAQLIEASNLEEPWKRVFVDKAKTPTGHTLALLPLVVDNMCNYEGVGEGAQARRGIYRILVSMGIDIRKLRTLRRLLLSSMGLKLNSIPVTSDGRKSVVVVADDRGSIFKITPILKDHNSLVKVMRAILGAAREIYGSPTAMDKYPWGGLRPEEPRLGALEYGIDMGGILEKLEEGAMVVMDLSRAPLNQGDIVSVSIVRRVFESRIGKSFEEITSLPVVGIVSEEAPLYLSPDKVRSPFNVFARIAREGRKFGVGLVAITQLATMIEGQILANFNTIIALRTKYRGDITYLQSIGVPAEALPYLGDREGYLYTPDLRVKEPIPIYIPGWFEEKVEQVEAGRVEDLLAELG